MQVRLNERFDHFALAPANRSPCRPWRARSSCRTRRRGAPDARPRRFRISFLLGRQAIFGQEPPIHRRSTTAVRRPDFPMCQAVSLPPPPLPRIRTSTCSGSDMRFLRGSHMKGRADRAAIPGLGRAPFENGGGVNRARRSIAHGATRESRDGHWAATTTPSIIMSEIR